jgi:hypothetical protein
MWKAFQRYRPLDPGARELFWQAVVLLPSMAVSLRVRGFQRTRQALQRKLSDSPGGAKCSSASSDALQRTCRMVKTGAHYGVGHRNCLEQSLVLWYLLTKQKIPVRFRIGVRKLPQKFEAHAWVEYEGVPLNQNQEIHQHYAAFESEFSDLPGDIS